MNSLNFKIVVMVLILAASFLGTQSFILKFGQFYELR